MNKNNQDIDEDYLIADFIHSAFMLAVVVLIFVCSVMGWLA